MFGSVRYQEYTEVLQKVHRVYLSLLSNEEDVAMPELEQMHNDGSKYQPGFASPSENTKFQKGKRSVRCW